jgi:hypothetical protein
MKGRREGKDKEKGKEEGREGDGLFGTTELWRYSSMAPENMPDLHRPRSKLLGKECGCKSVTERLSDMHAILGSTPS